MYFALLALPLYFSEFLRYVIQEILVAKVIIDIFDHVLLICRKASNIGLHFHWEVKKNTLHKTQFYIRITFS